MVINSLPTKMQQLNCFQGNCYLSKAQRFLFRVGWGWHRHETTCDGNHRLPSHHGLILWGCEVLRCVPLDLFNILTSRNIYSDIIQFSSYHSYSLQGSQVCMTCYHWRCEALTHASNKQSKSIKKCNTNTLRGFALTPCVLSCGLVVFNLKSKALPGVWPIPTYGMLLQVTRNQGLLLLQSLLPALFPPKANQMVTWFRFRDEHVDPITFPQMMSKGCIYHHHLRNETHSI